MFTGAFEDLSCSNLVREALHILRASLHESSEARKGIQDLVWYLSLSIWIEVTIQSVHKNVTLSTVFRLSRWWKYFSPSFWIEIRYGLINYLKNSRHFCIRQKNELLLDSPSCIVLVMGWLPPVFVLMPIVTPKLCSCFMETPNMEGTSSSYRHVFKFFMHDICIAGSNAVNLNCFKYVVLYDTHCCLVYWSLRLWILAVEIIPFASCCAKLFQWRERPIASSKTLTSSPQKYVRLF